MKQFLNNMWVYALYLLGELSERCIVVLVCLMWMCIGVFSPYKAFLRVAAFVDDVREHLGDERDDGPNQPEDK